MRAERGAAVGLSLKHAYAGSWSRRITDEHRLGYLVDDDDVIYQARFHYR